MAKNPHAVALARLSRQTPSPKQIAASKANGKRGGHPSLFKTKTPQALKSDDPGYRHDVARGKATIAKSAARRGHRLPGGTDRRDETP